MNQDSRLPEERPVRVGVLGCAEIARRRLMPAFADCPGTELVAVASRTLRSAVDAARPYGCRAVQGYEELLADSTVEAVYVPLPAALHAQWVEAALEAGKHVLAEKPLTLESRSAGRLLSLAKERRLALMENVMFVHHGQHETVQKLIAEGAVGRLRALRAEFTIPARPSDDIRYRPELGGGALWDTGVYPVRTALHLLGHELSVVGAALRRDERYGVDTAGAALLRTPEKVTAQLTFGLDHGYRSRYEVTGDRGRLTLDRAFTPPHDHAPRLRLERADGTEERPLSPDDQVGNTVARFAAAVRERTQSGAEESVRQLELLEEIRSAADASGSGLFPRPGEPSENS